MRRTSGRYHRSMTDRPREAPLAAFAWHPEPELIWYADEAASREAIAALGAAAWEVALDWLYEEGFRRPTGETDFGEARRAFFGAPRDAAAAVVGPGPAPAAPMPADAVLAEFRARLLDRQFSTVHRRSFSYFAPPPLLMSVVGELLAQVTDQCVDVWHSGPSAALVEEETVRWLCDLVGFGPGSFGVLTSGGVMANTMAMAVARDVHLARLVAPGAGHARPQPDTPRPQPDTPRPQPDGPRPHPPPPRASALAGARVYASDQAHFSIARALDLLGFEPGALRLIPSDDRFRLRAAPVAAAIAEDRAAGLRPFAIAAVAGSTNTGSVDRIGDLADLAVTEDLWLHVDAAYGGGALLSRRDAARVPHLDRADSVTIDPHKWFFQPFDIGALLVRRGSDLRTTFDRDAEYYRTPGHAEEPLSFYRLSMEGSRRFRALKLWLSWKHLGTTGLGRLVERTDDLAAHLARRISESDDFDALPSEPELSVVCFRHLPGGRSATAGIDEGTLDTYQDRLQRTLEASGEGWVSTTRLHGRTWLRAGIVNYLSTEDDADGLLDSLRRIGADVARSMGLAVAGHDRSAVGGGHDRSADEG
jgi:aromatic-L-amino-acid decarboxylase